jgi:hypothetical protein
MSPDQPLKPMTAFLDNAIGTAALGGREELCDYLITYAADFQGDTAEFYELLRKKLASKQVPELEVSDVFHSEGGVATAQRRYVRFRREKLHFDVCSAPFGTEFFFSFRCVSKVPFPLWLRAVLWLGFLLLAWLVVAVVLSFLPSWLSWLRWLLLLSTPVLFALGLMRMVQVDAETFYKLDARAMFISVVKGEFDAAVAEFATLKGIQLKHRISHPSQFIPGLKR